MLAGAVLLLLLGTLNARSFALFRCVYTGTAQSACCCPAAERAEDAGKPLVNKADCCRIEQVAASLPAGAPSALEFHKSQPPLLLGSLRFPPPRPVAVEPVYRLCIDARFALRTRAGPPLTIVHRRLLI